tara:strand:- start:437 stop:1159 length:723 start_codon:yes stop_codon:yes gene_type:complete
MIDFSIIVPCRDEEDNVEIILNNIQKNCIYQNYEIIFIDDYSQDRTLNKIKEFSIKHQNIFYHINKKKGLGGAISLGLKKAQGKYITIMMADSADSIDDLNSYFKIIQENEFDAIFGSRFIHGSEIVDYPKFKLFLNRIFNYITKILFFSDYNDFTNSFKIYKKEVIDKIHPIVSENFNIFLELPLKTISRGFTYKIVPIKYFNRKKGKAKFKIKELGSSYLFTLLYCFLEKILLNKKFK